MTRDNSPTLMKGYLEAMGKLRSRFNQIKNQGDPGPAVKTLMSETFNEGNSELASVLKYVDEQMLVGMPERARAAIRPCWCAHSAGISVLTRPVETELNRIWVAQVHGPFIRTLSSKYPFDKSSKIEAARPEIAGYGAEGAVAQFGEPGTGCSRSPSRRCAHCPYLGRCRRPVE